MKVKSSRGTCDIKFSFDTSIFIEIGRYYPRTDNPKLWNVLEEKLKNQEILISDEVIEELKKSKIDDLWPWITDNFPNSVIESDQEIQNSVRYLINKYKGWINPQSTKNKADPYVISVAIVKKCFVVSLERPNRFLSNHPDQYTNQPHALKIPNICQIEDMKSFNLVNYLVEIGNFS